MTITSTTPATEPRTRQRSGVVVAVLALAGIVAAGMQTLIVPLIGQLPQILQASAAETAWAVTATLLASAVAVPIAGRLGDMHGKRRLLLISLVPLIAGSALCALAGALTPMIVGRALQGLGMGVVPLGISLLREVVPPERIGSAVATMSASMGIGGAVGLPFAAAIAEYASWRGMFWTFAGLAALTFALVLWLVPAGTDGRPGSRFDFIGALLVSGGLVSLLLTISKGAGWGWGSPLTLGCAATALIALTLWIVHQLRSTQPLVNLRSLAYKRLAITNVASLLIGFAMYGQSLVIPQILQLPTGTGYGLGQSMVAMALWLAPGGVMMMLIAPVGARLSAARGPKTTLAFGALAIAAGYGLGLLLMGSTWGLMIAAMVVNVGVGLAYGAIPLLIIGAVAHAETGAANSFNTLVRSIGTSAAAAVTGVLLAGLTTAFGSTTVPSETGFRIALLVGGAFSLIAMGVVGFLPGHQTRKTHLGRSSAR